MVGIRAEFQPVACSHGQYRCIRGPCGTFGARLLGAHGQRTARTQRQSAMMRDCPHVPWSENARFPDLLPLFEVAAVCANQPGSRHGISA